MNLHIVIYFSVVFFLSELILILTKHSKKEAVKTKKDKNSLFVFWITIPLTLAFGFSFANYEKWSLFQQIIALLGIVIFCFGIGIRWISIQQLKKAFTVDVAISKDHKLKTIGIYKNIRHPSYLGLFLICFGLSLAMNSLLSFIVIAVPILFAIHYRIKIEESVLIQEFGESYRNYVEHSGKLFPKIGLKNTLKKIIFSNNSVILL
jgi:protein-S-isoprenylcysteine O-methyltransferase Ste14